MASLTNVNVNVKKIYHEHDDKIKSIIEKINFYIEDYNKIRRLYLKGLAGALGQHEYASLEIATMPGVVLSENNVHNILTDLVVKVGNELVKLHHFLSNSKDQVKLVEPENQKLQCSIEKFHGDLRSDHFKFFGKIGNAVLQGVFNESLTSTKLSQ
jgi:hypothetical protein